MAGILTTLFVRCSAPAAVVCMLCPRYLNSMVFTLASADMLPDDKRMTQMVLVLTAAVGFVIGGAMSWMWLGIPL